MCWSGLHLLSTINNSQQGVYAPDYKELRQLSGLKK
jgi:hypothetical protein